MPISKFTQFRTMLTSPELEFLMEAHDGLSAKIVEGAEFKGIWASGLSMSAALGVRDNNEASWTQILEILEFMADATAIPILVDGDTGFGNFNNVRRVVRKLCQRHIAAICIEDKLFPKTNSFIETHQPLADIDEFCGRIKAGKDSQTDPNFSVVARVEALIAGWGLDEALKRAEAYHRAGADAILIHSKKKDADEILAFAEEWQQRCPLIIVPTTYYDTPTDVFRRAGISMIIWANHTLRASITAMQEITRQIKRDESLVDVESAIVSVQDIFTLVDNAELAEAEDRYLPSRGSDQRAILMAASRGAELGQLTEDRPKCMLDIGGQPLLRRLIAGFQTAGIRDVTVIRGYRKEMINLPSVQMIDNDGYAETGAAASLACAKSQIKGPCVIAYGDILLRQYVLERILDYEGDIVLAVDALWKQRESVAAYREFVICNRAFSVDYLDDEDVYIEKADAHDMPEDRIHGEWIGVIKLSAQGAEWMRACLDDLAEKDQLADARMPDLLAALQARGHRLSVVYITGHWLDVDDAYDLQKAQEFL